jgi:hypothetical protein
MSKIVHQIIISDKDKNLVPNNLDSISSFFSNHEHIVWNYKKIKSFILKNKDHKVLDAIDSVKAYAFKADIARYYIVYKLGGWYTDLNNFFVSEPPSSKNDMVFFRDVQHLTKSSWSVQCSLFYANKNHQVMQDAINQSVDNVLSKYYGKHALCPTGTNLFGSSIAKHNLPEDSEYLIGDMLKGEGIVDGFYIEDKIFAEYKSNGLPSSDSGVEGGNSYEKLWHSRDLYV